MIWIVSKAEKAALDAAKRKALSLDRLKTEYGSSAWREEARLSLADLVRDMTHPHHNRRVSAILNNGEHD